MKKIFKEYEIEAAGGTITLKSNGIASFYAVNGSDVTITSGLTFTIDSASKGCVVRIYWLQNVTIGTGGSITILGNDIGESVIGGIMFTCVYNGTTWDIFQLSAEEYKEIVLQSNVAYVNYDLTQNNPKTNTFKSYDDAVSYITTLGTLSTTNHWTIKMPSGYCDEAIVLKAYVDVQGTAGTLLKTVTSNVAYSASNIYDSVVYDCTVGVAYVAEAKTANFVRCKFEKIEPVLGAAAGKLLLTDCTVNGADFSNTESVYDWTGNKFYAIDGDIDMTGLTFNVKDSSIIAYSGNLVSLPDTMINCLIVVPTITTTRATTIAGGKVVATSISAGANLTLLALSTTATITMATGTALVTYATKTGTVTLVGTATKSLGDNVWNGGTALYDTATSWNNGASLAAYSTSWQQGVAYGYGSTAVNRSKAYGVGSFSIGYEVLCKSAYEFGFGQYGEDISAISNTSWELADKLFSISNGTSDIARNDALAMLKDGTTIVDAQWDFQAGLKIGTDVTAASAANVGAMRYRSDANNSWVEMVMETSAGGYAWVVIKTNTW